MQESQTPSLQFRPNEPSSKRSTTSKLQSYIAPAVTAVIVLLALLSIPLFRIALTSAGLPPWLGIMPLAGVAIFLMVLFVLKLRNPAERTHGKHTGTVAEAAFRSRNEGKGEEGIEPFLRMLNALLDSSWTIYRDVHVPNTAEPIHVVLVGNTGVYALEVNTDSGNYRLRDGMWEWQDWHDRWRLDQKNPLMRLYRKRDDLDYFLNANRIDCDVKCRLVWGGAGNIEVPPDTQEIWFTNDGGDQIWQDMYRGRIVSRDVLDKARWAFEELGRRQS